MSDLCIETWGSGEPVVLIHGSLATGREEWEAQQPLAGEGYQLLVLDRRGYGCSPAAAGEDFLQDADDIAEVMGDGAHLVGHSYGGMAAMFAAARRPEAALSLALLEPAAFSLARHDGAARALVNGIREMWDLDIPDGEWAECFLRAVGTDPQMLPPGVLDQVVPLVPVLRWGRTTWDMALPLVDLKKAGFPKLVVSGGHGEGFEAICDELAESIDAFRRVVKGAGHEIQLTGDPINQALLELWRLAS